MRRHSTPNGQNVFHEFPSTIHKKIKTKQKKIFNEYRTYSEYCCVRVYTGTMEICDDFARL